MTAKIPVFNVPEDEKHLDQIVGQNVRNMRLDYNGSQQEVGRILGHTFQQVQKNERGLNRIGAGRLYQYSQMFGIPIDSFYHGLRLTKTDHRALDPRVIRFWQLIQRAEDHPTDSKTLLNIIDHSTAMLESLVKGG